MDRDFKGALEKKRILPFKEGRNLIPKELEAAKEDLEEAKNRFSSEKYKYATITAYYSMFHSARALLYAQGYREKSHHFLSVAIDALYVQTGKLDAGLSRAFLNAMILREEADYHSEFSKEGAGAAVQSAEDFLKIAKGILRK